MSRVTYATYRNRHLSLRQLWAEEQWIFSLVSLNEQPALHAYFLCAVSMTEATLLQHYQAIRASGSSLPHRAGKAYARLGRQIRSQLTPHDNVPMPRRSRHVTVSAVFNPKPDLNKLVRAVSRFVRDEAEKAEESDDPTDAAA